MPYVYYSDEQKLRANSVDLEELLERRGEKLVRSGPEKRLTSDHSITVRGNEWFDHATGVEKGGQAVSFMMYHYDLSYVEAVNELLGGEQGQGYPRGRQTLARRGEGQLVRSLGHDSPACAFCGRFQERTIGLSSRM